MTKEQFGALSQVFWKTATAQQLEATWQHYAQALHDLPPPALDAAVRRGVREAKEMPKPWQIREWATAVIPKSTVRHLDTDRACQHCDAEAEPTVRADGRPGRYYLHHRASCPNPIFSKPADVFWSTGLTPSEDAA